MKMLLRYGCLFLLSPCLLQASHAQKPAPAPAPAPAPQLQIGVDLLTDTNGVHADPYFKRMVSDLRANWAPLAQAAGHPSAGQEAIIHLTLASDGKLLSMHLESPATEAALSQAAWTAARDTPYRSLPAGMNGRNFELRVHFVVGELHPHVSPADAPWT